ncbi:alpha carbonic anhydrase [Globomyces pollinis-pini]|nr:alpha carbonic anhydrase [Globomyces pollinis-pini]
MLLVPLIVATVSAHLNCLSDALLGDKVYKRSGEYSYENENPEIWGTLSSNYTLCKKGKHQSPINFEYGSMLGEKHFAQSWSDFVEGAHIDNHNGLKTKVAVPTTSESYIIPDGESDEYKLLEFHFHIPSEHHRNEEGFPLEAHFVHATADKRLAVVGFWFFLAEESTPFLDAVFEKGYPESESAKIELEQIDLRPIKLNIEESNFWSYSGSLTVPPCTEGVKWAVSDTPLPISIEHYEGLRRSLKFTARPTQKNLTNVDSTDPHYGGYYVSGAYGLYSSLSILLVFLFSL